MAKCDVCGTMIPLGEDRCPSCGYRYKKDKNIGIVLPKQENETILSFIKSSESIQKMRKEIDFSQLKEVKKVTRYISEAQKNVKQAIVLSGIIILLLIVFITSIFS